MALDEYQVNCSTRRVKWWERILYPWLICPECNTKMTKINWVYEPGHRCNNVRCRHIVWEELPRDRQKGVSDGVH